MRILKSFGFICFVFLLLMSACAHQDNAGGEEETGDLTKEEKQAASADSAEIEVFEYGEKLGLELETPASEEATTMNLKGEINQSDALNEDYLWVVLRKKDHIEEIRDKKFEYFIPIEDGQFAQELKLHHGEGEYVVAVRLPSEAADEEDTYYDAAEFTVDNLEDGIEREVELSKFGVDKGLEMSENVTGWNTAEETFELSGTVGESYNGERLFAEVEKDSEKHHVVIPIEDGEFSGEVPLNYGEGTHAINLQLIDDDEDDAVYYDSAKLYVNNESDKELPEFNEYEDYLDSGLILEAPAMDIDITQDEVEYPVKGTIDKDAPLADDIDYVIVSLEHMEEHDQATYYIPVEDYEFDDMTHFRFGPGEYEVTFNIPEAEQEEGPKYYYSSVLSLKHDVTDIKDKRDILPSRGTESDDPVIVDKAEEITEGLDGEREKAKAIYEYVAKNIDYDVEKYDNDVFNPDDNAIDTLESGKGICQDYTFLTTALLRSVDIESRYIEGHAGARHAWVEAKVDGDWIELDPTWGAGYVDGDEFIADYNEDYFDPDTDLMEETHTRQGVKY